MGPMRHDDGIQRLGKWLSPLLYGIVAALYLAAISRYWKPEWDSAFFIALARSLVQGNGYSYLGYPSLKSPFGFPLLLSPFVWLCGNCFFVMNVFMALCALAALWATYSIFRKHYSREYSVLISLLTGISYLLLERSTCIMTDVPYMAISLVALVLISNYLPTRLFVRDVLVGAGLIVAAYFVRSIGISILLGVVAYAFLSRTWMPGVRDRAKKVGLMCLIVAFPVAAWSVRNSAVRIDPKDPVWELAEFIPYSHEFARSEYDEPLSATASPSIMAKRVAKNGTYYAGVASSLIAGQPLDISVTDLKGSAWWRLALMGIPVILIALGFVLSLSTRKHLFDFYVLFYMLLLMLPSAREDRYLLPVLPFVLHYFIVGTRRLLGRLLPARKRATRLVMLAIACLFVASNALTDSKLIRAQHRDPYYSQSVLDFMSTIQWVKSNTTAQTKVISVRAPWVVLLAERWAVSFPWVEDQNMILRMFRQVQGEYLVTAPVRHNKQRYLIPVLQSNPTLFEEQFRCGEARVYRINQALLGERLSDLRSLESL